MAEVPNLAGVATKDLVETIGTGSFKASYINWARTMNLLHEHAPGWSPELLPTHDGNWVHAAPGSGGFLMIRFVHTDGSVRPAYPQSIMDHRNNAIPLDKITARDVTDTHRRGACMAAAMEFSLGYELWAKMPLESGYSTEDQANEGVSKAVATEPTPSGFQAREQPTQQDFLEACLSKGLTTMAADNLLELVAGNFAGGLKTLSSKTAEWVAEQNAKAEPKASRGAKKSSSKPAPEDY
jgi:hypothetical protein